MVNTEMKRLMRVTSLPLLAALSTLILAGCTSSASRMADCQQQGISKDTCYLAEQNRQATINAAAEKQAMENAQQTIQHAQAAHKVEPFVKHVGKVEIKRDKLGLLYVDGHAAAQTESTADAQTYQSGLYDVIIYKNGKVALMNNGQFVDYAK